MFRQIEEIRDTLLNYLEARIELFQLETRERIEDLILKALYFLIGTLLVFVSLLFMLILVAVGINIGLDSPYAGYLIVLGLLVTLSAIWFLFRERWLSRLRVLLTRLSRKKEPVTP